ncbi:hypothetical protein ICW40_10310 [Actinotalea ferrariae]|nr:hypothetical protein [Actinotalea ferrariae]MBX9245199.1 hypothetical protein [Actinotalea ferrariae]
MQVTIDSTEPLEQVLAVVGALYGVRLKVAGKSDQPDGDQGVLKPRHG